MKQLLTRRIQLVILLITLSLYSYAQNANNNLQFSVLTPWNFTCNSVASIEVDQVINNAFKLTITTKTQNCSMYAKISSYTVPAGFVPSGSPLAVAFRSTNSNLYANLAPQLTLQAYDQLLFTQTKTNSIFDYYYDLKLFAIGYNYIPGNYSYTVTLTMTQP
jgi:hypothetical protein